MVIRAFLLLLSPATITRRGANNFASVGRKQPCLFFSRDANRDDYSAPHNPRHPWTYRIERCLEEPRELETAEIPDGDGDRNGGGACPLPPSLPRALRQLDPAAFPSTSQARRACRLGRVLILRRGAKSEQQEEEKGNDGCDDDDGEEEEKLVDAQLIDNLDDFPRLLDGLAVGTSGGDGGLIVGSTSSKVGGRDVLALRTRSPDRFYPPGPGGGAGYVHPPPYAMEKMAAAAAMAAATPNQTPSVLDAVLYEDDHIAVVNKPEWLNTVGEKRKDLRSILPFLLRPPTPPRSLAGRRRRRREDEPAYLPRPVHRLDRRTSGCVVVAKTARAASVFSAMFAARRVRKSYAAVVFGVPQEEEEEGDEGVASHDEKTDDNGPSYSIVDYPIDGRDSVTLWRTVATIESPEWGPLSLLDLRPRTGRTHQIRRHLSYCLGTPIVGDSKYDGGGARSRRARSLGMFLCSDAVEFEHELAEETTYRVGRSGGWHDTGEGERMRVTIPLPSKFTDIMATGHG